MGFFGRLGRWNINSLKGYTDFYRHKRNLKKKTIPQKYLWEAIEKRMDEVKGDMQGCGTNKEQRRLLLFLSDLKATLPKHLSEEVTLSFLNLLDGAVNLWGLGKVEQEIETAEMYKQRMRKAGMKPEHDSLVAQAQWLYAVHNENARGLQDWIQKFKKDHGVKPDLSGYDKLGLKQISMAEAFRRADKDGKYPNAYATFYRTRTRNQNKKTVSRKRAKM